MASFVHIARNTVREILRQPIFFLMLLSALVLIGIYPLFTLFVFREQVKLVIDSAMATALVFGWITAVLCASHTVAREIDNGTVLLVLAKPVNRGVFLAAKVCGVLVVLAIFAALSTVAALVAVRVAKDQFNLDNTVLLLYFGLVALGCAAGGVANYRRHASFAMAAVLALLVLLPPILPVLYLLPVEEGVHRVHWPLLPPMILIGFSIFAMGTLATALSTRLDMVPNLIVCGAVFVGGLVSDYLLGPAAAAGNPAAFLLYNAIPNWQLFWLADALAAHKEVPWSYVGWGGLYIVCFIALFYLLALALFHHREVGKQDLA